MVRSEGVRPGCLMCVGMHALCRGSEFRTAFKRIGGLRALADVPFMALSASSPPSVAKDIEESLHMKSPVYITHSLDRPSIFLSYSKSRGLAVSIIDILSLYSIRNNL